MFRGLHLRLTLTYIAAALGLVLLMGLGTLRLLRFYFQADNDAALRYRVALEYESLGIEPSPELEAAKEEWESRHGATWKRTPPSPPASPARRQGGDEPDETGEPDEASEPANDRGGPPWKTYPDSELAPLFVLHLDVERKPTMQMPPPRTTSLPTPSPRDTKPPPTLPTCARRPCQTVPGSGWPRIVCRRPLFSSGQPIAYVQAGRQLADQDRVLGQILLTVLLACGGAAVAVGLASWYLAGRSLGPARKAWEQQQVFVANASHELRAPVTLIRASAEYALRQSPVPRPFSAASGRSPRSNASDPNVAEVLTDMRHRDGPSESTGRRPRPSVAARRRKDRSGDRVASRGRTVRWTSPAPSEDWRKRRASPCRPAQTRASHAATARGFVRSSSSCSTTRSAIRRRKAPSRLKRASRAGGWSSPSPIRAQGSPRRIYRTSSTVSIRPATDQPTTGAAVWASPSHEAWWRRSRGG